MLAYYLHHQEFILFTDHDALKHLNTQDTVSSRHASWAAFLQQFTFILEHKSGVSNRVADALSRRHLILPEMHMSVLGFKLLPEAYQADQFFAVVLSGIQQGTRDDFQIVDGFLFKSTKLCISSSSLRDKIISELHEAGHVGRDRTIALIHGRFFWLTIHHDASHFVEPCCICQVSKGTASNAGLYSPLPVPSQP